MLVRPRHVLLLILTVAMVVIGLPCVAWADSPATVRVGIVESLGYIEPDENGDERGYDADFTLKIAQYAGLKVQWVVEDNYSTLLTDLENGTIDMAPGVSKTSDREQRFIFSDTWMGRGNMSICARSADGRFDYGEINQLKDKHFGVLAGSSMIDALAAWASSHGFEPNLTQYSSEAEVESALMNSEVDLIIYGGSPPPDGSRVINQFNPTAYYMVFARDNTTLKTEVDSAMSRIMSEDTLYQEKLFEKYRGSLSYQTRAFTTDEKAFIAEHPTVKVAVLADNLPYSEVSSKGVARGIIVDYYDALSDLCGVDFEYVAFATQADEFAAVANGEVDMVGLVVDDVTDASNSGLILTTDYTTQTAVELKRVGTEHVSKVAVLDADSSQMRRSLALAGMTYEVTSYNSVADCFAALENNDVDAIFCGMPAATWILNQHRSSDFTITTMSELNWGVCGGVAQGEEALGSVLSKATLSSGLMIDSIIATNTLPEQSFMTLLNRLPLMWTIIAGGVSLVVILVIISLVMRNRRQRELVALTNAESDLKAAEEARRTESEFLSNMSHDMRTPLNGILGFTGLAISSDDPGQVSEYLEKIEQSGNLMLDLVNDVLDLSKLESGKMELHPEVVDARELVRKMTDTIRQLADDKGITFVIDTERASFQPIRIDSTRAEQIFLNLLSNAVKYTPEGGTVWFTIERLEEPVDGCDCRVTVRDNGIGMSKVFLPHVFEPFVQEGRKESRNVQGTGLGLSIVKKIVDEMGGTISVESVEGKGSTFVVQLPIEPASPDQLPAASASSRRPPLDLGGRRVIVCEDNRMNQEIADTLLGSRGIEACDASDGRECLDLFMQSEEGSIDAILMDVRMPVMDGIEATMAIRSLSRPDAKTVPIIAMTADAFKEDVDRCMTAGMTGYVSKPIDPNKLDEVLSEFLG